MPLKDYLKSNTKESSMRLGFIICVITGCACGLILGVLDEVLNDGENLLGVAAISTGILAAAFTAKGYSGNREQINQKGGIG